MNTWNISNAFKRANLNSSMSKCKDCQASLIAFKDSINTVIDLEK